MRRFISVLMTTVLMAGCLAACSSDSDPDSDPVVISGQTQVSGDADSPEDVAATGTSSSTDAGRFDFVYNGIKVSLGTSPLDVVDQLGDYSLFESESCAFQGTDRVYTYNSFVLRSSPDPDGNDVIVSIELKDDTVETAEGIYIGMSESDVTSTMGAADTELAGGLEYSEGDSVLTFVISDGAVSAINYTYINE